jgi:hypothetical protein
MACDPICTNDARPRLPRRRNVGKSGFILTEDLAHMKESYSNIEPKDKIQFL